MEGRGQSYERLFLHDLLLRQLSREGRTRSICLSSEDSAFDGSHSLPSISNHHDLSPSSPHFFYSPSSISTSIRSIPLTNNLSPSFSPYHLILFCKSKALLSSPPFSFPFSKQRQRCSSYLAITSSAVPNLLFLRNFLWIFLTL